MYGNFGRRSPSPMRNQVGGLRRGGARLVGGIIPPPPPPPPPSEPDRDEAFVQETGIKVFHPLQVGPPRMAKKDVQPVSEHSDEDHDSHDEEEDEEDLEDEDDDCYEIIMDDAIIEEDNEDEEDEEEEDEEEEEEEEEEDGKSNKESVKENGTGENKKELKDSEKAMKEVLKVSEDQGISEPQNSVVSVEEATQRSSASEDQGGGGGTRSVVASLDLATLSMVNNKSSSGVSSNGSSSGILHSYCDTFAGPNLTPVKIDDSIEIANIILSPDGDLMKVGGVPGASLSSTAAATTTAAAGAVTGGSNSDISRSSSGGSSSGGVKAPAVAKKLSSSLKGLNQILLTSPVTTAPPNTSLSAHTTPTKEPLGGGGAGGVGEFLVRGKPGRMSLPLRDRFVSRPINFQDNNGPEMRAKDASALRPTRTIWFRRAPKNPPMDSSGAVTAAGVSKSQQQQQQQQKFKDSKRDDGWSSADEATMGPTPRQRSGTWSLANSRRRKERLEKEEEVQARQRRRSGDDSLNSSTLPASSRDVPPSGKERKKEASPGFLESFRPRSKSDAARLANKKTNIMASVRNAVQHTLVSPGGGRGGGGRRSGENTPPLDCRAPTQGGGGEEYHHYTWHAGGERSKTSSLFKVLDLFRGGGKDDDKKRRSAGKLGERGRRNSGDLQDRSRTNSGSLTSVYIRGMDPTTAANVFRDCRGLPEADPLIQYLSKEEESQILVKFFKLHHSYDLIPTSAKLVIFDTSLQVKKAFYALVRNGVRAAPLWDHARQKFVGMLTITDFIRILHSFHHTHDPQMEKLEDHRLYEWRTFLQDEDRPLISISPDESLYDAIRFLIHHKIHRLPVIDPATGNVLYIITHKRILKFLYLYIKEIPKPAVLQKTLGELGIGTYDNIETATADMLIIEALDKFVKHRISALPIVDAEGKLQDIYAKFDVINLAAEGTYHKLDVTLRQANEYRNEWFEGVLRCRRDEKLITVMDRIVHAEVHRLVVVDNDEKVIGIVSLSDILKELVLRPCDDESPTSAAAAALKTLSLVTASQIDAPLTKSGSEESCGDPENLTEGLVSPEGGKGSSGDSEDEGRYSMDKSEETPPAVTTPEVIPISG